ncbi:MAG: FecR domain-containing protein [Cyanobacteria bacterium P01_C01_bin.70]
MSQYHLRSRSLASLACLFTVAIAPPAAKADIPLTHAEVKTFRNRVELLLRGDLTRPLRTQDRLGFGDAIRTRQSSQVDLQFNDGSQVRLGEQTTFWFIPNSRNLRLTQGTALFIAEPDSGSSAIATPNAVATARDATVAIRHVQLGSSETIESPQPGTDEAFPETTGRTAIMVIAEGDRGSAQVSLPDGRSLSLSTGQIAIVDNNNLFIFEFDLALFFETSPLVQGLAIAAPDSTEDDPANGAMPPEADSQPEFVGDYWLDPRFLSPNGDATVDGGWLFPTTSSDATDDATETDVDDQSGTETTESTESDMEATESTELDEDETAAPSTVHEASETEPELTPPSIEDTSDSPDSQQPGRQNGRQETPPAGVIPAPSGGPTP